MQRFDQFIPVFYTKGLNAPYTEGHIQIVRMIVKSLMLLNIKSIIFNFKYDVSESDMDDNFIDSFRIQQKIPIANREDVISAKSRAMMAYSLFMETIMVPRFLLLENALKNRNYVVNIVNCFRYPRIIAKKIINAPIILHFYFLHRRGQQLLRLFADKVDLVIASSRRVANFLSEQGILEEKIALVYPPIDTEFFKPFNKHLARTTLGLPKKANIILYIGNLKPTRFPEETVLDVIQKLMKQIPEVLLLVFAPNSNLNILRAREIFKKAKILGLTDKVKICVKNLSDKDKAYIYAASDVFFFPESASRLAVEPPLTALEAMATGGVVFAPLSSSLNEIIVNNKSGFLFETDDNTVLSNKLADLLIDENLMLKISQNSRKTILNKASIVIAGREMFRLQKNLLNHTY